MESIFDVDGTAGEPIDLPIGPGPATGHSWRLELPEGVRQIDDTPATDLTPGSPPGSRYRVVATSGEHTIQARLGRPWETEPVRTIVIRLHVTPPD